MATQTTPVNYHMLHKKLNAGLIKEESLTEYQKQILHDYYGHPVEGCNCKNCEAYKVCKSE